MLPDKHKRLSFFARNRQNINGSWKINTKSKCKTYVKQWILFFKNEKISTSISLKHGLDFLPYLSQKGKNYSLISAARSILPYFLRYYG